MQVLITCAFPSFPLYMQVNFSWHFDCQRKIHSFKYSSRQKRTLRALFFFYFKKPPLEEVKRNKLTNLTWQMIGLKASSFFLWRCLSFNSTFQLEYCTYFKIFIHLVSYNLHHLGHIEGQWNYLHTKQKDTKIVICPKGKAKISQKKANLCVPE